MRPETLKAKADLDLALHQGPRRRALQKDRQRQSLATLATTDSHALKVYLASHPRQTYLNKRAILTRLHAWLGQAGTTLTDAGQLEIHTYARILRETMRSPVTAINHMREIKHFYAWLHSQMLIASNPAAGLRVPTQPRRSRLKYLTIDQLSRFLDAAIEAGPPWDLAAHLYALNGLRLSDALNARIQDLDVIGDRMTLTLPNRKGGVMDTVSLPAPTVALLDGNIGSRTTGPLVRYKGRVPTKHTLYSHFTKISDAANLDWHVLPHQLRATFITLALDAGIPYRDIAASSGHTDTKMIDYYDRAHASIERNVSHHLAAAVVGRAKQHHTTHGEWEE